MCLAKTVRNQNFGELLPNTLKTKKSPLPHITSEQLPSSAKRVHRPEDLTFPLTSKDAIATFHLQARHVGLDKLDRAQSSPVSQKRLRLFRVPFGENCVGQPARVTALQQDGISQTMLQSMLALKFAGVLVAHEPTQAGKSFATHIYCKSVKHLLRLLIDGHCYWA